MKIRKRAEQKNFRVNQIFYNEYDLSAMLNKGIIDLLFDTYVVYASDCNEVKVIYDDFYGMYCTVVTHKSGVAIRIVL